MLGPVFLAKQRHSNPPQSILSAGNRRGRIYFSTDMDASLPCTYMGRDVNLNALCNRNALLRLAYIVAPPNWWGSRQVVLAAFRFVEQLHYQVNQDYL